MSERLKINFLDKASNPTFVGTIKVNGDKVRIHSYRIDIPNLDPLEAAKNLLARPEEGGEQSELTESWLAEHDGKQLVAIFYYLDGHKGSMIGGIGVIFKGVVYKKGDEENNEKTRQLNKSFQMEFKSPFK